MLDRELRKVLRISRRNYESGYREAVRSNRGQPHDPKARDRYFRVRYNGINKVHPLVLNGFFGRMGHVNHDARRNDWHAVSTDITNLRYGRTFAETFSDAFDHLKWYYGRGKGKRVRITHEDNVGAMHWPQVLQYFNGIMDHTVESLSGAGAMHITANRRGGNVTLNFQCPRKPRITPANERTLRLIEEVVHSFGGTVERERTYPGYRLSITLPHKIRADGHYGGYVRRR